MVCTWQVMLRLQPVFADNVAGLSLHDHQALEHAGHLHVHAQQAAITSAPHKAPEEKGHNPNDCVLCHLATHLLVIVTSESSLPQAIATVTVPGFSAEPAPAQGLVTAYTIRGPPHLSLI